MFRQPPRALYLWSSIAAMLWFSLAMPLSGYAMAVSPSVSSSDDAPLGVDVPPAQIAPDGSNPAPLVNDSSAQPVVGDQSSLQITGDNALLAQLQQYAGSGQSAEFQPTDRTSSLSVSGALQPNLFVNAILNSSPTAPADSRWTMNYDTGKGTQFQFGEINTSLAGNDLVNLTKSVRGLQVNTKVGKGVVSSLVSELPTPTQTDLFSGHSGTDPYYLTMLPMVKGSEVVTINDKPQSRGTDYTLDSTTGALTFSRSKFLTANDQIQVRYSVMSDGTGGGRLFGLRASYPVNNKLTVGVSHLGLTGQSVERSDREEKDQFVGRNIAGPFYLTYRPIIANSAVLKVNGVTQLRNTAYTLEDATGKLTFRAGHLPAFGALVDVTYRVPVAGQQGQDRSVTGVDVDWHPGNGIGLNLQTASSATGSSLADAAQEITGEQLMVKKGVALTQQVLRLAKSPIREGSETVRALSRTLKRNQDYTLNYQTGELRLLNEALPLSGDPRLLVDYTALAGGSGKHNAMTATATYNKGKVNALARYRTMEQGFTPMDLTATQLVDRAVEWSGSYAATPSIALSTSGDNSRVPGNSLVGASQGNGPVVQQNRNYTVDLHAKNLPTMTLQHTSRTSTQTADARLGDSTTSDTMSATWSKKALTATVSLDRTATASRQAMAFDAAGQPVSSDITSFQNTSSNAALNVSYQPGEKLNIGLNLAKNKNASGSNDFTSASSGKSMQLMASYKPSKTLMLNAKTSTSSTSAEQTSTGTGAPAQQNRNTSLGASWMPSQKFTAAVNYITDRFTGGYDGNNSAATLSANANWNPNSKTSVTGYLAKQGVKDSPVYGSSNNTLVGVGAKFSPKKNTTVSIDVQHLKGQNGESVNNLWQTEGQTRRLSPTLNDGGGLPASANNELTAINGSVSYHAGEKHDFALTAEMLRGKSDNGGSQRDALGIGWHYHPDENLTLALDARKVKYLDSANAGLNYNSTEFSAQATLKF